MTTSQGQERDRIKGEILEKLTPRLNALARRIAGPLSKPRIAAALSAVKAEYLRAKEILER